MAIIDHDLDHHFHVDGDVVMGKLDPLPKTPAVTPAVTPVDDTSLLLTDLLASARRRTLPPICWDDTMWRDPRDVIRTPARKTRKMSAGRSKTPPAPVQAHLRSEPETKGVDLMNLYTSKSSSNQGTPISFKELTAEFDRMLKPLSIQFQKQNAATGASGPLYDTSVECPHPVLAIEPRNPATPPRSFKIHKQRTVIRPGYTISEPVLLDIPINSDCISPQTFDNILDIAENMRPLPPRVDNFTHFPASHLLSGPCYGVPLEPDTTLQLSKPAVLNSPAGPRHSKCSATGLKL